ASAPPPATRPPAVRIVTTSAPCSMTAPRRRAPSANPWVTPVGSAYPDSGSKNVDPSADGKIRGPQIRLEHRRAPRERFDPRVQLADVLGREEARLDADLPLEVEGPHQ